MRTHQPDLYGRHCKGVRQASSPRIQGIDDQVRRTSQMMTTGPNGRLNDRETRRLLMGAQASYEPAQCDLRTMASISQGLTSPLCPWESAGSGGGEAHPSHGWSQGYLPRLEMSIRRQRTSNSCGNRTGSSQGTGLHWRSNAFARRQIQPLQQTWVGTRLPPKFEKG